MQKTLTVSSYQSICFFDKVDSKSKTRIRILCIEICSLKTIQLFFVYIIRLTHFLNLLRSNYMSRKSMKSSCWMKHLKYSRNVNDDSTSQKLIVSKCKFTVIFFLIINHRKSHRLMRCRIFSKIELFEKQRVLNFIVLKKISFKISVVMMKSIVNVSYKKQLTHATKNECLLQTKCSNFEMSMIMQNTTRYIFVSMSEKTIEIWTYISINKQSICLLTLSKHVRSKTMWIFNCEMYRIWFWKKNVCDIETCDFESCWFRSNHHIRHLKYDFNF